MLPSLGLMLFCLMVQSSVAGLALLKNRRMEPQGFAAGGLPLAHLLRYSTCSNPNARPAK